MRVECKCGMILKVPEDKVGKTGQCPACKKTISIPAAGVPAPAIASAPENLPTAPTGRAKAGLIMGGVLVAVILVVFGIFLGGGGGSEAPASDPARAAEEVPESARNGPESVSESAESGPEAAFQRAQKIAADGDSVAFYDLCDDDGQRTLFETAAAITTMEIYSRRPFDAKDINAIKKAFEEELGVVPDEIATAENDPAARRKYFLLFVEKSQGQLNGTLAEGLAGYANVELVSIEMEGDNWARLTCQSDVGRHIRYMARQRGKWLLAGGMSPTRPPSTPPVPP